MTISQAHIHIEANAMEQSLVMVRGEGRIHAKISIFMPLKSIEHGIICPINI